MKGNSTAEDLLIINFFSHQTSATPLTIQHFSRIVNILLVYIAPEVLCSSFDLIHITLTTKRT